MSAKAVGGMAAVAGMPEGVEVVAPDDSEELSELLAGATREGLQVAIWGGGTHRDMGCHPGEYDLVVSTAHLTGIVDWQPDDLTVVVRAGTPVGGLEEELGAGRQSAILPEQAGAATVGGVVATSTSPYARLRYGPTRDRILEVEAVTGDGRPVKGGGRVVKNVTGYDLPRLFAGSFGSLGVITSLCLKLWPLTEATRTVVLEEPPAPSAVHRPRAVLQTRTDLRVLLSGTEREVEDQVRRLGGEEREGLEYPDPPEGEVVWSLRVPPGAMEAAVERIPDGSPFVAQLGVGEVSFGVASAFDIADLRGWAERAGGSVVRLRGSSSADPWGTPPAGLDLQRRVIAAFDPARILERGRLPGGL
ncbi:MAG: FAD-binding oxidoreductase [Actinomycetota bacterium]